MLAPKNFVRQERNGVRERRRDRIVNTARVALKKGVLFGAIGCLADTALGPAYACDEPHLHQTTRAAGFLRDCGGQTPATVTSIHSGCPNAHRGLVASGSSVIFV